MKKSLDFGFVILHYKTYRQTRRCVDSIIKNMKNNNYFIVIVDNFSENGSIEKIKNEYLSNNKIYVIKNNFNMGFARGNNVGIRWININYSAKFIVVLNNDTQILNNEFASIIKKEYNKSHFSVMGPQIILKDNTINPMCRQDVTLERAKKEKKYIVRQIIINVFHLEKLEKFIKKIICNEHKADVTMDPNQYYTNVVLHGSFLIFSNLYFMEYDGFDDRTFLYHEEELLFLRIKKSNLVSVYNPTLKIFHEEDAATNFTIPSERTRAIFKLKNVYKSNKILISDLKEMENDK